MIVLSFGRCRPHFVTFGYYWCCFVGVEGIVDDGRFPVSYITFQKRGLHHKSKCPSSRTSIVATPMKRKILQRRGNNYTKNGLIFSRKQPNNNNNNTGNSIPRQRPLSVPGIPLSSRPTPIPDAGRSVFTLPPPRRHNSSLGSSPSESVEEILETTVMTPFSA